MLTKSELKEITRVIHFTMGEAFEELINPRFDALESRMDRIESQMDGMEKKMGGMVTKHYMKEYMDEKLGDLRGDLLGVNRKQEHRMDCLVDVLEEDRVLTKDRKRYLNKLKAFKKQSVS